PFAQMFSNQGQFFWVFLIATEYSLAKCKQSNAEDQPAGLQSKKIGCWRSLRVQEPIQLSISRRNTNVCIIPEKIAVQVHIVLVEPPEPCHPVWIQHMDDDQGAIFGEPWQIGQQLKLDRRSCEPLNAVDT